MLCFSEVNIDDKALFDSYFKFYNPQISELTFTNIFMWRNFYKFRYAEKDGMLCIIGVPDESEPFAFSPIGRYHENKFQEVILALKEYFNKNGWTLKLKKVSEMEIDYFKGMFNPQTDMVMDRDNSDYVYLQEELKNLSGKKYDAKRNHIKRFKSEHEFEYEILDSKNIEHCYKIMDEWCTQRNCNEHRGLYCEKAANFELLNHFHILGCQGAYIKVDGQYEAFTVGEMLNDNTAVIHIEKASTKMNGLYTLVNQQFCVNNWDGVMYINREQDLGMEGLRKAKLSYHPVRIVNKYTITIK